jgi:hypothetical protein
MRILQYRVVEGRHRIGFECAVSKRLARGAKLVGGGFSRRTGTTTFFCQAIVEAIDKPDERSDQ